METKTNISSNTNAASCESIFNYSDVFFSYFSDGETLCDIKSAVHQLIYVFSGEIIVAIGEQKKLKVPAGKCVFIKKDHRVRFTKRPVNNEPYKSIAILFDRNFLRQFYQNLDQNSFPDKTKSLTSGALILPESAAIESIFTSLFPYLQSAEKPIDEVMQLKIKEAIVTLLHLSPRFYPTLFDFTEPWKIDILDFLNENYKYELSMEEIAQYTGRSLATFKRDFKKISDLTPQKWLQKKRLEKAHELLQTKHIKIGELYLEVGFKNRSHFATAFKKEFGKVPTELNSK